MEWSSSSSSSSLTGLREVCVDPALMPSFSSSSDVFSINTGGSLSTLQDLKTFSSCSVSHVLFLNANSRFIVCRVCNDSVDLSEFNLDANPQGRQRAVFSFNRSTILPDGVSLQLVNNGNVVVLLVPTINSLHRLNFAVKERGGSRPKTVLSEAASAASNVYSHFINNTNVVPTISSSFLTVKDEALFALANLEGDVHITKLGYPRGMVSTTQLKCGSYLTRLWDSFANNSWIYNKKGGHRNQNVADYRGGSSGGSEAVVSLCLGSVGNSGEEFVFAVCRDHRLRVWSVDTSECVLVEDLSDEEWRRSSVPSSSVMGGAQGHIIKRVRNEDEIRSDAIENVTLVVFFCMSTQSRFVLLRPQSVNGQITLRRLANIVAPDLDLVDFEASSTEMCTLWTDSHNEPVMRFVSFNNHGGVNVNSSSFLNSSSSATTITWNNATLEQQLDASLEMTSGTGSAKSSLTDPRQVYLSELFSPGRFSNSSLIKALKIYRRGFSKESRSFLNEAVDRKSLREEICIAVETEICSSITGTEINDEFYREVAIKAWERLHSCAVQYELGSNRALGVSCCSSGLIVVIKQEGLSFLRPMEWLEHIFFNTQSNLLVSDPAQDLFHIMDSVDALINPQMEECFSSMIRKGQSADQASETIISQIISQSGEEAAEEQRVLNKKLNLKLDYLVEALESLLGYLELDNGVVSHEASLNISFANRNHSSNSADTVFASQLGNAVVAETFSQLAHTRFEMCRNAVVLLQMLLSNQSSASSTLLAHIHSTFLPRFVVMTHCYNLLVFLASNEANRVTMNMVESNLRQMSILSLRSRSLKEVDSTRMLSLSELFMANDGGKISRDLLTTDLDYNQTWRTVLLPLSNILAQLLWPRCAVPHFQKFLLNSCQYSQIQEYVRLQSGWCDWHCHSRQFLLAMALLNTAESEKACDLVMEASIGVHRNDDFLNHMVFNEVKEGGDNRMVLYFLKCIELFQHFGYYDCVVDLAEEGIRICDAKDPNKTTLCHILFLHHLKLQHHDEAYRALILNPDKGRRRDSLRQFTITLLDRNKLNQLSSYLFVDMMDEFEFLIMTRARTVDVVKDAKYYHFLYALHSRQSNFRKAASAMYELGLRLSREAHNTLSGLKSQAQAYLAAINCLSLEAKRGAWIVNPEVGLYNHKRSHTSNSPKRPHEEEHETSEAFLSNESTSKMKEIIEIEDIQKELDIVNARLALVKINPSANSVASSPGRLNPSELLLLLCSANLFEEAIKLGSVFQLDLSPVLEALSSRCARLSRAANNERQQSLGWLTENSGKAVQLDDRRSQNIVDAAFDYLHGVLLQCETKRHETKLHKVVTSQLLSQDIELPAQLVLSYKKKDATELMRLYFGHDRIEKAAELAIEYIAAVMGNGKEYFGIDEAINANAQRSAWLPYHMLDVLVTELEKRALTSDYCDKLRERLTSQLGAYFATAERVAADKELLLRRDPGHHDTMNQSLLIQ